MPTAPSHLLYRAFRLRLWQAMHDAVPQGEQGVYADPPAELPPLDRPTGASGNAKRSRARK